MYHGQAKELLSNIAILEITVSDLEEEMVSLQFQLSQERNERRLAEYHLKHSSSQSPFLGSPENMKRLVRLSYYLRVLVFVLLFTINPLLKMSTIYAVALLILCIVNVQSKLN